MEQPENRQNQENEMMREVDSVIFTIKDTVQILFCHDNAGVVRERNESTVELSSAVSVSSRDEARSQRNGVN